MAGHAYRWDLMGVSPAVLDLIEAAIRSAPPQTAPAPGQDADTVLRNRMKQLKSLLPECVTFSHLRLALAHRARVASTEPHSSAPETV